MHATIMHTLPEALLASVVCLLAWILYCFAIVARRRIIIKRQFPGPPTTSFLLGAPVAPFVLLLTSRDQLYTQRGWLGGGSDKRFCKALRAVLRSELCCADMQATSPRPMSLIVTR